MCVSVKIKYINHATRHFKALFTKSLSTVKPNAMLIFPHEKKHSSYFGDSMIEISSNESRLIRFSDYTPKLFIRSSRVKMFVLHIAI